MARTAFQWRLKRRRLLALAGLLALLVLLVGRGLGWFGRSEGKEPGQRDRAAATPPAGSPAAVPPLLTGAAPMLETAVQEPMAGEVGGLPEVLRLVPAALGTQVLAELPVPSGESGGADLPGHALEAVTAAAGMHGGLGDLDHAHALVSLVRAAIDDRRFALAQRAMAALGELSLAGNEQAELAGFHAELAAGRAIAAAELQQQLAQGRVLAAELALASMASADLAELIRELQPMLAASGLPTDFDAAFAVSAASLPQPGPLPLQRAVRLWRQEQPVVGMVVDSRPLSASVRLVVGGAVSFPRLHLTELEPLQPTAAEAVELALAARHANRPRRARLWWLAALALGGEQVAVSRREEVLALLR